jgi:hypothetical protein
MHKRFLAKVTGMKFAVLGLAVLAALAVTGCETEASVSSGSDKGRTIVLSGVPAGVKVGKAEVFAANADIGTAMPVGGGAAANGGIPSSGGEVTIGIQPYSGSFSADSYLITIEAGGERRFMSGVSLKASRVSLNWEQMTPIETAQYAISLTAGGAPLGNYTFEKASVGYTEPPPALSVTVTNTGTDATGPLTVTLVGTDNAFTLSTGSIADIAPGVPVVNAFSVQPKGGLSADLYAVSVEVRGANSIFESFFVSFTVGSETPGEEPDYNIELTPDREPDTNGAIGWTMIEGGETPPPLTVTIKNNGEQATGALSITLFGNNDGAFTLSTGSIADIAPNGGIATFLVQPNGRLTAGDHYTAMVAVGKGENNPTLKFFGVSLKVDKKDYKISLSQTDAMEFTADVDYTALESKTVTITNIGNVETGTLTVTLSGNASAFTVTQPTPRSIAKKDETATFTVVPNTGLGNGTYNATVTVGGTNITDAKTFEVTFSVEGEHSISLGDIENTNDNFGSPVVVGYTDIAPKVVTITNTSKVTSGASVPTGKLKAELSETVPGSFKLSTGTTPSTAVASSIEIPSIDSTATFNVVPKLDLLADGDADKTYSATVTVSAVDKGSDIAPKHFTVSFTVQAKQYNISLRSEYVPLTETSILTFDSRIAGYTVLPDAKTVTITNGGNVETGPLTVTLSKVDGTSFGTTETVPFVIIPSTTLAQGIPLNETTTFTVRPNTGLTANDGDREYTATVTVGGTNIAEPKTFNVSFTVEKATYAISLSGEELVGDVLDFGSKIVGYTALPSKTVTIRSSGNVPTGLLTVTLEGTDRYSFTVTPPTPSSITATDGTGTAAFTVVPNTGLTPNSHAARTYNATVIVGGTNIAEAKTFTVSFTVADPSIILTGDGMANDILTFASAEEGYTELPTRTVTIRNTGQVATGDLTVAVTTDTHFEIKTPTYGQIPSIPPGDVDTFTIVPKFNLGVDTHTATVVVMHGTTILWPFTVKFTVVESTDLTYSIALNKSGTHSFGTGTLPTYTQPSLDVTITNTGTGETGALRVDLDGTDKNSFTVIQPNPGNIEAKDGTAVFTVKPNPNLNVAKTYEAIVKVSNGLAGNKSSSKEFNVTFTLYAAPDAPPALSYSIALGQTATMVFEAIEVGYGPLARSPRQVAIINTGTGPTGDLTVSLIDNTNTPFGVATASDGEYNTSSIPISSINSGASAYFWVRPRTALSASSYTATVTVGPASGNNNGITEQSFQVFFTVNPSSVPSYRISLSKTTDGTVIGADYVHTFEARRPPNYTLPAGLGVSITNVGNVATGPLDISLSDSTAFTLSRTSISYPGVEEGTSSPFTVTPRTGLTPNTYTAIVTVGGTNIAEADRKTFTVSFTVNLAFTYGISLQEDGKDPPLDALTFGPVIRNDPLTSKTVIITNTGTGPTGALTVTKAGNIPGAFTVTAPSPSSLTETNGTATFTVVPTSSDLSSGTYTATVTVGGANLTEANRKTFDVSFTVNSSGPAPTYDISLDPNQGIWNLSAPAGYGTQTPQQVTINNPSANGATGALTVSLSNNTDFEVARASGDFGPSISIGNISSGASASFRFRPKTGLTPRMGLNPAYYETTVTVGGGNLPEVNWKTFTVRFTVEHTYGISLSRNGGTDISTGYTHPFGAVELPDYTAPAALTVTIRNTGTGATGNLTVALSNSSAFTLSTTSINSIAANGTTTFTVRPNGGLTTADTYTATVTVSGANGILRSFGVSFTVDPAPIYSIGFEPETWAFPDAPVGYGPQTGKSVTVRNTGTRQTGPLTVSLPNNSAFTLSTTSLTTLAPGGTSSFTVTPINGRPATPYSAAVTVSNNLTGNQSISAVFNVSFTVLTPINIYSNTMPTNIPAANAEFIDDTDGQGKVLLFKNSVDYTAYPITSFGQVTPTRIQVATGITVSLTFIDVKIGYALPAPSTNENTGSALDIGAGSIVHLTIKGVNEVSGLSNPGDPNNIYLEDRPSINMAAGSVLNITSASTGSLKAFYSTWQPGIGGTIVNPYGTWIVDPELIPDDNGTININGGSVNVATRPGLFSGAELASPNITSNITGGGRLTPQPSGNWLHETSTGSGTWVR